MENKLDIQVGDRITYKYKNDDDNDICIAVISDIYELGDYKNRINTSDEYTIEILKIERPRYEVVEEKKELLTEEEKEYLKNIIKPLKYKSLRIRKTLDDYIKISIDSEEGFSADEISLSYIKNLENLKFENLEEGRNYNLKELGLEGEE